MAICGNSAILALSPIIGAPPPGDRLRRVRDHALRADRACWLLPVLGRLIGLGDAVFGMWAGLAVNDTAQVVATGYAYSAAGRGRRHGRQADAQPGHPAGAARGDVAGRRGPSIGPARRRRRRRRSPWSRARCRGSSSASSSSRRCARRGSWTRVLPTGGTLADLCSTLASLLILVALAGVGLATDVRAMLGVGAGRSCSAPRSGSSSACSGWASHGSTMARPMDVGARS